MKCFSIFLNIIEKKKELEKLSPFLDETAKRIEDIHSECLTWAASSPEIKGDFLKGFAKVSRHPLLSSWPVFKFSSFRSERAWSKTRMPLSHISDSYRSFNLFRIFKEGKEWGLNRIQRARWCRRY